MSDEAELLMSAWLDGELDDDGVRRLERWLEADPANQRRFLLVAAEHRALGRALAAAPADARPRRRAPARRMPWLVPLATAASLLALAGWWWRSTAPPAPPSAQTAGAETAGQAQADPGPRLAESRGAHLMHAAAASDGSQELRPGDRLEVDPDGAAGILYADGTRIRLLGRAAATLSDDPQGKRLVLQRGSLTATVAHQPPGHPLRIVAATTIVEVVGTELAVTTLAGETAVEVTTGAVRVHPGDGPEQALAAGERLVVAASGAIARAAIGAPTGRTYRLGAGGNVASLAELPELGPGDLVELPAGSFHGARILTGSGTALRPIVLRGIGGEGAVIDGDGVDLSGVGAVPRALLQIQGDQYRLEHLTFVNASNHQNAAAVRGLGAGHVAMIGCRISRCDDGVTGDFADLLLERCDVGECGTPENEGMSHDLYPAGDTLTLRGCHVHDATHGQALKSSARWVEVEGCVIEGAADGEISLIDQPGTERPGSGAVFIGNLVVSHAARHGNTQRFLEIDRENDSGRAGVLRLVNNTCIAGDPRVVFVSTERGAMRIEADSNIFYGSDHIVLSGSGGVLGRNNWLAPSAAVPAGFTQRVADGGGDAPGFVDASRGDFHLAAGSPCIDRATPDATCATAEGGVRSALPALEPDGVTPGLRVVRGSAPDVGAFESR
jgi:ferric-dicitrate binding protein FerR (iron transport regulator)